VLSLSIVLVHRIPISTYLIVQNLSAEYVTKPHSQKKKFSRIAAAKVQVLKKSSAQKGP